MSDRPMNESEIIDVLLGQAGPEVRDRVRAAARSNPEIADLYEQWARTLPALRGEREHAKAVTGRVRECVMARLAQEDRVPSASVLPTWARLGAAAGLAATVCAVALLVLSIGLQQPVMPPGLGPASERSVSADLPMDEVSYVAHAGERGDHWAGTSRAFKDLAEAIEAVPAGGVLIVQAGGADASTLETPRLTKPMRIEARGGPVRFGLDPDHV